jgi:dihydrofolate reductase
MRKVVVMMSVSVDGFMSDPQGQLGWQLVDEELHTHFNELLAEAGAFLDGRVTYELMAEYWPTADQDPTAPAPIAEFARIWRAMPKVVYSRTLESADWGTTVVREVVAEEVQALKAQPGGDLVLGGAELGDAFRRLDLVDEYRLYLHPVVLGQGRALFRPAEHPTPLRLVETRVFGSGVVLLRYERAAAR